MLSGSIPNADTFELSLFGCGIGECVALHVGNGSWILIDSCRVAKTNKPLHVEYLQRIGVSVESSVSHVVITHWHDDHIDGASDVVAASPNAKVVCSAALTSKEFLSLLNLYSSRITDKHDSGIREMLAIDRLVKERMQADGHRLRAMTRARSDQRLWAESGAGSPVQLISLSPSDGSIERAHQEIRAILNKVLASDQALVLRATNRNHYSVALWFQWHAGRVLLGGDLEVTADPACGWTAVLNCHQFPDGKARVVKIAHHGSPNGDGPSIWENLIADNAIACLTAFNSGRSKRPSPDDIKRISQHTDSLYATTLPRSSPARRENPVEKELATFAKKRSALNSGLGQVRVRWPLNGAPEVEVDGFAQRVR